MSFLGEIRRRKVFQVAAVYAVVAWLIVQVVGAINEPLSLPDWLDTVVIVFLAVGFPVAVILAWAFDVSPAGIVATAQPTKRNAGHLAFTQRLAYVSQALILLAVVFLVFDQYFLSTSGSEGVQRSRVEGRETNGDAQTGGVQRFYVDLYVEGGIFEQTSQLALSRDGSHIAFQAVEANAQSSLLNVAERFRLFLRPLDELEPRLISGAGGVQEPFFSPDGQWIAYKNVANGQLEKVSLAGGAPQRLLDRPLLTEMGLFSWDRGDWSSDGFIFFSDQITIDDRQRAVFRVSENGGAREQITVPATGIEHTWPQVLPGDQAVAYTAFERNVDDTRNSWIEVHSLESGLAHTVVDNAYNARYTPSGHLLFVRDQSLWAVPFDPELLQTTGDEAIVVEGITTTAADGKASYAVSDDGLLVYTTGFVSFDRRGARTLSWVTQDGESSPTGIQPTALGGFRLSPDGSRVAIVRGGDIWTYDLVRGTSTRLTTHPASEYQPLWTPDGERVVFGSTRDGGGLFWRQANGLGDVERLTTSPGTARQHYPESFSPDGTELIFTEGQPFGSDILVVSLDSDEVPYELIASPDFDEDFAAVSPDGRWIAYESDESGITEIYVRPFPNVGEDRWTVSAGGGRQPAWSADGAELYFLQEEVAGPLLKSAVATDSGSEFVFGPPEVVFARNIPQPGAGPQPATRYAPHGEQFLVLDQADDETEEEAAQTVIVENWFTELELLAPQAE